MVTIKTKEQIAKMRIAGDILARGLAMLKEKAQVGVNLLTLDQAFSDFLKQENATSNFLGYNGFPKTICVSINDQLVHGIPTNRVIKDGDVVSIDAGCIYEGMHADSAFTKICGVEKNKKDGILIKATEKSLELAIEQVKPGARIGDLSSIIQQHLESFGFQVPRDYTGHGIGTAMHEDPYIPNYGVKGTGMRLKAGMVIAIEPMSQIGTAMTKLGSDG
jgi:methionyl aminopeptidase